MRDFAKVRSYSNQYIAWCVMLDNQQKSNEEFVKKKYAV